MKLLQEIYIPQESVNDQSLSVVGLNFKDGDFVRKNDIVIELETSKAVTTIEAEVDGYIVYHCKLNDEVAVNTLIIEIFDTKPEKMTMPVEKELVLANASIAETNGKVYNTQFSKKALALIKDNNLSRSIFEKYDFVNEELILNYLAPAHKKEEIKEYDAPLQKHFRN
jgi:pyruvate/2-oxoglutarate dehydrogenase complex dihydrolipoamide acyltransferase (E2) component